jgi:hypothetical protein
MVCWDITIDAHGLKIQGRGYLMFLSKSLGGVKSGLFGLHKSNENNSLIYPILASIAL